MILLILYAVISVGLLEVASAQRNALGSVYGLFFAYAHHSYLLNGILGRNLNVCIDVELLIALTSVQYWRGSVGIIKA